LLKNKNERSIELRKVIVLTTIIILSLVLTGCGNGNIASKPNETSTKTTQQAGNDFNKQPDTKDSTKSNGSSTSNQTTGSTAIVAKSENIMSSRDKAELLNQVDKELDSLFNNINTLDDPQDADLDLNQK
jgi:hypothetical protein